MTFSDLQIGLQLNIRKFTAAMDNVRRQTQRFSSELARVSTEGSAARLIAGYTSLNDKLHQVGLSLRDIARISSGIMISQAFYTVARSVREATQALWEFNESLDYATVTYSALMGSNSTANSFIETLKEFSVNTIFEYSDIENMSRKLLAYGIEYKNLMYIIEGLTNIGTLSGDTAALERLAVAIGQINAKGTLKAEEVRQLANAYTPIYDILRDKLGLTEEDFKSIGDLGISSAEAINAIIEYTNEQFGSVADAAMYTITGLNNRIVDTFKVLGSELIKPLTTFYKSLAYYISEGMSNILDIYRQSGIGGVFEHLVPDKEWQHRIRQLLANLSNFMSQFIALVGTLWPTIKQTLGGLIDGFSWLLTIVNATVSGIIGALQSIAAHTPLLNILSKALVIAAAAWVAFKIQALGAMVVTGLKVAIVGVANAVLFLARAITAHPIVMGLMLLGAVMLGVSANANNANSAISNLMKTLNSYSVGGKTADDILQAGDAMNDSTTDSEQFWESMEEGAKDTEDAVGGAGDAAKKAAKSLLSFDEVFKLNENTDSDSGLGDLGSLDGIGDLAGALGGLGQALIPEIPDLSSYASDFVSTLYHDLWDAVKTIGSGAASGALIGALVGFSIGGLITKTMSGALTGAKWGAKIGSIAGAGFAGFWTDTYKEMEASLLKIVAGGSIGTLAGGLIGMVVGAFATRTLDGALTGARYGAMIGGLIGSGIGAFWAGMTEEMSNAIESIAVGSAAFALAGGLTGLILGAYSTRTLKGALTGAKWGASIGSLVGAGIGAVFGVAEQELIDKIESIALGGAEGALVGGLAGLILGAFATQTLQGAMAGAKLGSAIGGVIGAAVGDVLGDAEDSIGKSLENMFSSVSAASYGALIGGLAGLIVGAIVGAFAGGIGALPGAKAGASIGAAIGSLYGLLYSYLESSGIIDALTQYLDSAFGAVAQHISEITSVVSGVLTGYGAMVYQAFSDILSTVTTHFSDVYTAASNFANNVYTTVSTLYSDIYNTITTYAADIYLAVEGLFTDTYEALTQFFSGIWEAMTGFVSDTIESITTFFADILEALQQLFTDSEYDLSDFFMDIGGAISRFITSTYQNITGFFGEIVGAAGGLFIDILTAHTTFASNITTAASTLLSNIIKTIGTYASNIWQTLSTLFTDILTGFTNTFTNVWTMISNWFEGKTKLIKTLWEGLFNVSAWKTAWELVKGWFSDFFSSISNWFTSIGKSITSWWNGLWDGKEAKVDVNGTVNSYTPGTTYSPTGIRLPGHAYGGIFNREHIARFAEGNKAEMAIPLENASAMQPFVNAISDGILQGLLPAMSTGNANSNLPPMYVGTLIADERGLLELYKKFELYETKELARKGLS